jgi:proline iminopeptidase
MTSVRANGIEIACEALGDPADPTILLLMGLGLPLVAWPDDFCTGLVELGFRVVRFDNRDCGLSSRVGGRKRPNLPLAIASAFFGLPVRAPYTLDDMADDAVGVLDALRVERAHLVGVSLGGMIAQVVSARHADRVSSLTSIMSASGNRRYWFGKPSATRAILRPPPDPSDFEGIVAHLVRLFDVIGSPGYPADRGELREIMERSVRRSYDPAGTARQLLAIAASGDRRAMLRRITAPTLVVHGAADPLVPVGAGRDTARHIARAKLMVVEGLGHDLPRGVRPMLVDAIAAHCSAADVPQAAHDAVPYAYVDESGRAR